MSSVAWGSSRMSQTQAVRKLPQMPQTSSINFQIRQVDHEQTRTSTDITDRNHPCGSPPIAGSDTVLLSSSVNSLGRLSPFNS